MEKGKQLICENLSTCMYVSLSNRNVLYAYYIINIIIKRMLI